MARLWLRCCWLDTGSIPHSWALGIVIGMGTENNGPSISGIVIGTGTNDERAPPGCARVRLEGRGWRGEAAATV